MYDPTIGRFLNEDPLGVLPDSNPYRYVHNSPTNFTDPTGLREAAKSGGYVAGPVKFSAPQFNELDYSDPKDKGRIGSNFQFTWENVPSQFVSATGCKLCDELGAIQIEKEQSYFSANGWLSSPLSFIQNSYNYYSQGWGFDESTIDYPYQGVVIKNPSVDNSPGPPDYPPDIGGIRTFTDTPNSLMNPAGRTLIWLKQDFEVYIVCLKGVEQGVTYGGYKWGHQVTLKTGISLGNNSPSDYIVNGRYYSPLAGYSSNYLRLFATLKAQQQARQGNRWD